MMTHTGLPAHDMMTFDKAPHFTFFGGCVDNYGVAHGSPPFFLALTVVMSVCLIIF